MDRKSAEQLMAIYASVSANLNEASEFVHSLPEAERAPHLHGLGRVMADLWLELQLPVVREHRELDPDGDKFQRHHD